MFALKTEIKAAYKVICFFMTSNYIMVAIHETSIANIAMIFDF